jgi:hypothetical protein
MLLPWTWKASFGAAYGLLFDYAHLSSVRQRRCVDAQSNPVPWYTYPAIDYLRQLDFSDASIFEYGSGSSTLFWAAAARRVVSVEDDEEWYGITRAQLPANCELTLETDLEAYPAVIDRYPEPFDVIVVDGAARGRTRLKCAKRAIGKLRDGGMIILDNSDWLPESARLLRESGLIQVDMTGFAPISGHTQTTSFFLHRAFAFQPRGPRQPLPGPGAVHKLWERPDPTEPPLVACGEDVFGAVERDETFAFDTPARGRAFRFLSCRSTGGRPASAAIIDLDRDRVLLAISEVTADAPTVEAELAPVVDMSWPEFCGFVNAHPKRRYALKPTGELR